MPGSRRARPAEPIDVVKEFTALRTDLSALSSHLDAIKRLMIVFMLRSGMGQRDVAKAMGVDQSVVSRMFKGIGRKALSPGKPDPEK
jgi:transposase-like protein